MSGLPQDMVDKIDQAFNEINNLRNNQRDQAVIIAGLRQQVSELVGGSHMTAPLVNQSHPVLLDVGDEILDEGAGTGLWQAKRLAYDEAAQAYVVDTEEDTKEYCVEPHLGEGTCAAGSRVLAMFMRVMGDDPPKGVYQVMTPRPFLAVVTGCDRDPTTGSTTVTTKRLQGLPYSYESGEEATSWAGFDPLSVSTSLMLIFPIQPLPDNPEITSYAIPHIAVDPSMLDEPQGDCLATFGSPCDSYFNDPCIGA